VKKVALVIICMVILTGCSGQQVTTIKDSIKKEYVEVKNNLEKVKEPKKSLINAAGKTIGERFFVPEGFERVEVEPGSFQEYLRNQHLKPDGAKVLYYDGREKNNDGIYAAVMDYDIGNRDLHQCADAVMLLRAEYLLRENRIEDIHFNFVNGFKADYSKWKQGWGIKVSGNNATWVKSVKADSSYESFRRFMDMVFAYAGTMSLEKELREVDKADMRIGDVYIKGASPGHAVIVVDMAENKATGEKLFMLAQSYMPAQQTQVLCNPDSEELNPWYSLSYQGELRTPEWTFQEKALRRFQD
jgi:hypothetical protein